MVLCGRQVCVCKIKSNVKTLRQIITNDLKDNLSSMFREASEADKKRIEADIQDLIKSQTDFPSYQSALPSIRIPLLRQSIGFVLFGE